MAKIILFIGAPGSGKGSRGKICEEHGCVHISSSRLLSQAGYDMKCSRNILDEVVIELIKKTISDADKNATIILDGFPRNMEQVEMLERESCVNKAIYFKIPKGIALQRIKDRIICPNCGEVYTTNLYKQPKQEGICDVCGSVLKKRDGDNTKVFRKRLSFFVKSTYPVITYYAQNGKLITLDATQPNEEIITLIDSL